MTDREMLEWAAKAAGMRVGYEPDGKERGRYDVYWSNVHHQLAWHGKSAGSEYPRSIFWNPIADDGDAFRLAVKLKLDIRPSMSGSSKFRYAVYDGHTYGEVDPDPLAATRRAIVKAAAEIERSMK